MHTFSPTDNAARCLNVPRWGEGAWPRPPRDGTGWGACVACLIALPLDRRAAGLADWQKFGTAGPDSLSPSDRRWWEMSVWAHTFKIDLNKRNVVKKRRPRGVWTPADKVLTSRHTVALYLFSPPQFFSSWAASRIGSSASSKGQDAAKFNYSLRLLAENTCCGSFF